MILAGISVWICHLRTCSHALITLLEECRIVIHPMIIGDLACGNLRNRSNLLTLLSTHTQLWTQDKRLYQLANTHNIAYKLG